MGEILRRLFVSPVLAFEVLATTFLIHILGLASTVYVILVLNRYVTHGIDATLVTLTAGVLIALGFELTFRQLRLRFTRHLSRPHEAKFSSAVFDSLLLSKVSHLQALPPGAARQVISGLEVIRAAFGPESFAATLDFPFALIFLTGIYFISPPVSGLVFLILVAVFMVGHFGSRALKSRAEQRSAEISRIGALTQNLMSAGDTVRAFNGAVWLKNILDSQFANVMAVEDKLLSRRGYLSAFNHGASGIVIVVSVCLGAVLVVRGELDVASIVGINILASRSVGIAARYAALNEGFISARQKKSQAASINALAREPLSGVEPQSFAGRIGFKDLSFVYPGQPTPLFESFSLDIAPGEIMVIHGANGTGKTTLCRMLAGLLDPVRGQVLVDGADLRQVNPAWWRRQIMYLPQEPHFLNATWAENLKIIRPDATDEMMMRAIARAGLQKYVASNPQGLNATISGNGEALALGIRRRLALARALMCDGSVAIFDEPTGGLDEEGCNAIYEVMNQLANEGRTIIAASRDTNIVKVKTGHWLLNLDRKPIPEIRKISQKVSQ